MESGTMRMSLKEEFPVGDFCCSSWSWDVITLDFCLHKAVPHMLRWEGDGGERPGVYPDGTSEILGC